MNDRPGSDFLTVLAMIGIGACSVDAHPSAQGAVVHDSAGVQIVENRGLGLWADGERWLLASQPRLEIGSAGGELGATLFRVTGAVRLSDGRIVVANGGTSELLFFSSGGVLKTRAGGAGGGPGQFAPLLGFANIMLGRTAGDSVLAYDWAGHKIVAFSPAGGFVRSVPLHEGDGGAIYGATGVGWLEDGSLVARNMSFGDDPRSQPGPEGRAIRPRATLRRFAPDGLLVDTIGVFPGDESFTAFRSTLDKNGTGRMEASVAPVPFGRTFRAAVGADMVALGVTDRREVQVYGPGGALRRLVRGPGTPQPVVATDRNAWIKTYGGAEPVAPFPATMPAFEDLVLDSEGCLWVEAYVPPGALPGPSNWSVYDPQGRFLGVVAMPERLHPLEIGAEYVLGLWKNDLDVELVRLYDLRTNQPPGNECSARKTGR